MPVAEIVRGGELAEVAAGAGLGLGVIAAFAIGLRALIAASENWQRGRTAAGAGLGALGAVAFAGALAGTVYALAVIVSDGPLS
jgi:hypothetical protein